MVNEDLHHSVRQAALLKLIDKLSSRLQELMEKPLPVYSDLHAARQQQELSLTIKNLAAAVRYLDR